MIQEICPTSPVTPISYPSRYLVGASRFERPTTRTPSEYATGLRHAPTGSFNFTISRIVSLEAAGKQSARKRRGGTAVSQDATPKL